MPRRVAVRVRVRVRLGLELGLGLGLGFVFVFVFVFGSGSGWGSPADHIEEMRARLHARLAHELDDVRHRVLRQPHLGQGGLGMGLGLGRAGPATPGAGGG